MTLGSHFVWIGNKREYVNRYPFSRQEFRKKKDSKIERFKESYLCYSEAYKSIKVRLRGSH